MFERKWRQPELPIGREVVTLPYCTDLFELQKYLAFSIFTMGSLRLYMAPDYPRAKYICGETIGNTENGSRPDYDVRKATAKPMYSDESNLIHAL